MAGSLDQTPCILPRYAFHNTTRLSAEATILICILLCPLHDCIHLEMCQPCAGRKKDAATQRCGKGKWKDKERGEGGKRKNDQAKT